LKQVIGGRGEIFMRKHKIKYTNELIGKAGIVPDFLPCPADLVVKEDTVKITLSLTKDSVNFFKEAAESHHTHYQTMIRNLLDRYAAHYIKDDAA